MEPIIAKALLNAIFCSWYQYDTVNTATTVVWTVGFVVRLVCRQPEFNQVKAKWK